MLTLILIILNIIAFLVIRSLMNQQTTQQNTPHQSQKSQHLQSPIDLTSDSESETGDTDIPSFHPRSKSQSRIQEAQLAHINTGSHLSSSDATNESPSVPTSTGPKPPTTGPIPCENCSCGLKEMNESKAKAAQDDQKRSENPSQAHQAESIDTKVGGDYSEFIAKDDPTFIDYSRVKQAARPKPKMPDDSACCGTGCVRCVFDIYDDNLEKWQMRRDAAVAQQIKEYNMGDVDKLVNGTESEVVIGAFKETKPA